MVATLTIQPETLKYYIYSSEVPFEYLQDKCKKLDKFLSGEKQSTFNQLSEIARKINVPTGLLLLSQQVETQSKRLEFRTVQSSAVQKMSPELRDTIFEMEDKQDFLREEVETPLSFIGQFDIHSDYLEVARKVRQDLAISEFWQEKAGFAPLNYFRSKVSELGVFVFFNGKVKDNTHRPLNLNEFRGFSLKDEKAPIIFVNQKDSKNGQLFTLVHELVHLYVGVEEILNQLDAREYPFDQTEAFVNKVTGDLLVPQEILLKQETMDIEELAKVFKVSQFVIARRLFDLGRMSKKDYRQVVSSLEANIEKVKKGSGGNYNNNLQFRIDSKFFHFVENALYQNRITYTEAFQIVGVGIKGYKTLQEGGR